MYACICICSLQSYELLTLNTISFSTFFAYQFRQESLFLSEIKLIKCSMFSINPVYLLIIYFDKETCCNVK